MRCGAVHRSGETCRRGVGHDRNWHESEHFVWPIEGQPAEEFERALSTYPFRGCPCGLRPDFLADCESCGKREHPCAHCGQRDRGTAWLQVRGTETTPQRWYCSMACVPRAAPIWSHPRYRR